MPLTVLRLLSSASLLAAHGGGESWNEILKSGTKFGMEQHGDFVRSHTFTEADLRDFAETFPLVLGWYQHGVSVGCNHAAAFGFLDPESSKALGWLRRVEVRPNGESGKSEGFSLWGLIDWTVEGADRVTKGEFGGFSVEIIDRENAVNKDTGERLGKPLLIGGTVCNDPFWPGMEPLAAPQIESIAASEHFQFSPDGGKIQTMALSERAETRRMTTTLALTSIASILGLSSSVTELEATAALSDLKRRADESDTHRSTADSLLSERDTLRTERDALKAQATADLFGSFCADGRCVKADESDFLAVLSTTGGRERVGRIYSEPKIKLGEKGHDGSGLRGDDGSVSAEGNQHEGFISLMDRVYEASPDKGRAHAYSEARKHFASLYTADGDVAEA